MHFQVRMPIMLTITLPAISGGNPMPEVTGFLDDVEQFDVDTVENEVDGVWEVEKEYSLIPSR